MAGYIKGSRALEDMLIQRFGEDLKKLYKKAPQAKAEIVTLTQHIAEVLDMYMESAQTQELGFAIFLIDGDKVTEIES